MHHPARSHSLRRAASRREHRLKTALGTGNDDRFRGRGSRYEHEEPVTFAAIKPEALIDWSDGRSPESTLWIPESLFGALAAWTRLGRIDVYKQTRLNHLECEALCRELLAVESAVTDPDIRLVAKLVREKAYAVAESSEDSALLVEGP